MSDGNIYAPPLSDLEQSDGITSEYELASRWSRLGGAIIDAVIGMAVGFPIMYLTGAWEKAMAGSLPILDTIILGVYGFVMFALLHGYFLKNQGQTIGKKLVGIKIVSVDTKKILTLNKVLAYRYLPVSVVTNIPVVGQFLALVDIFFIFGKNRRCVHDFIAGTRVIKVN